MLSIAYASAAIALLATQTASPPPTLQSVVALGKTLPPVPEVDAVPPAPRPRLAPHPSDDNEQLASTGGMARAAVTANAPGASVVANAPTPAPTLPDEVLGQTRMTQPSTTWLLLLLSAVAVAAVFAVRRRRRAVGALSVVDSASIGKGRQLLVVEVGGERMLLAASEGGVAVLKHNLRLAPRRAEAAAERGSALSFLSDLLTGRGLTPRPQSSFASVLDEGVEPSEESELRRQLTLHRQEPRVALGGLE